MRSNTDTMSWSELGTALGYPPCCIEFFDEYAGSLFWVDYLKVNPWAGTGFVCCPKCIDKPVAVMVYISLNRDGSLPPFPDFE